MAVNRGRYGDILSIWNVMNRMMNDSFVRIGAPSDTLDIPIDLYDAGDEYVLHAMVPGTSPEQVQVTILGDKVQIRGAIRMHQADPDHDVSWLVHEIPHGSFSRTITLPQRADAEQSTATSENGILTLHLRKVAENRPQQIKITSR